MHVLDSDSQLSIVTKYKALAAMKSTERAIAEWQNCSGHTWDNALLLYKRHSPVEQVKYLSYLMVHKEICQDVRREQSQR